MTPDASRALVFPPPNLFSPLRFAERPIEPKVARKPITWADWDAAIAHNSRGLALAQKRNYAGALAAFAESWKANPNHMVSRYNAACGHALLGRPKEAMKHLEALQAAGGFRALTLLAAAASDSDLASLRSDLRFRELTTATAPTPAWGDAMAEGARDEDEGLVISDAAERLCLVRGSPGGEGRIRFRRFDCDSGQARGELSGTREEVAATLDELGARRWSMIAEGDTGREKVLEWARVALVTADENAPLYRSPSATHVAANLEGADGDGRVAISTWPGQPMVAYLPDDGQGQLLSYGLPAISEDGRYVVALARQDGHLGDVAFNSLIVRPTQGRAGSQSCRFRSVGTPTHWGRRLSADSRGRGRLSKAGAGDSSRSSSWTVQNISTTIPGCLSSTGNPRYCSRHPRTGSRSNAALRNSGRALGLITS